MYKNIVPGLVSIDTELCKIPGFVMSQDFDFFINIKEKNKYHYKIVLTDDIEIPQDYEFKSEYYAKKKDFWYFERKIFFLNPKFKYDYKNKIFYFNKTYFRLPISLGGLFTVGEHISNMIDLDLFLDNHIILRGMAIQINGKNICITSPGFNGKTTLLKKILKKGAGYIAEDYLIINLLKNQIYPTCPLLKENFWRRRDIDDTLQNLLVKNKILKNPISLDDLYLTMNSQDLKHIPRKKQFIDFVLLNSLFFLNNLFTRSFIFEHGLSNKIFDQIANLKKIKISYKFINTKNFNNNFL